MITTQRGAHGNGAGGEGRSIFRWGPMSPSGCLVKPFETKRPDGDIGAHLCGQSVPCAHAPGYRRTRLSRRAFETTVIELTLIATLANIGCSSQPVNGYSAPAASGSPAKL